MTLSILIKKMYIEKKNIITSDILRRYCRFLGLNYYSSIRYLLTHKYLYRILRGIFYVPSINERKLEGIHINHREALVEALRLKGVVRWYFGMETALKFHNITHEFFPCDVIISDTLFRARPMLILGQKVRFIKMKPTLLDFGIVREKYPFSNLEKTVLDIIYLARYEGLKGNDLRSKFSDIIGHCSKKKLMAYAKRYNKEVESFVQEAY